MKLVPLGSIADIQLGKMLSPKAKIGSGFSPYLRNQNVQWGGFQLADIARMAFSDREKAKFELRIGDLLVCEGGEPGRCAVWAGEIAECYYQKAIHRIRPHPGDADPDFLALWIRHQAATGAFEDQNAKTTIAHLPLVRLQQLPVPVMPIRRQRELAETLRLQLALSDEAREAAQRQVTELDALFRSLYKDAFAGIVPVNIQTALGPPLPGWQWASLSEVARLESGHTPSRLRADWWGGDVSWISLTEIRKLDGCWTEETELRTNEHGIANSAARILPTGTVCYSRTASLGFVTIMGKPMATSQDFANWVCGPELDPEFLMHALIRSRVELRALATGATHKTIYMPALASFQICMPALPVQKDIVTALKHRVLAWRAMNLQARNRMSDLELLPSRLLTEAFGAI